MNLTDSIALWQTQETSDRKVGEYLPQVHVWQCSAGFNTFRLKKIERHSTRLFYWSRWTMTLKRLHHLVSILCLGLLNRWIWWCLYISKTAWPETKRKIENEYCFLRLSTCVSWYRRHLHVTFKLCERLFVLFILYNLRVFTIEHQHKIPLQVNGNQTKNENLQCKNRFYSPPSFALSSFRKVLTTFTVAWREHWHDDRKSEKPLR